MTGGGAAADRWELKNLMVKAMKVAREAGGDESEQMRAAVCALLMRYSDMSGGEAIEWVEQLAPLPFILQQRTP